MDNQPEYVVDPSMRFSDIIVPTIDTVRAHFLLELLIKNAKQVNHLVVSNVVHYMYIHVVKGLSLRGIYIVRYILEIHCRR